MPSEAFIDYYEDSHADLIMDNLPRHQDFRRNYPEWNDVEQAFAGQPSFDALTAITYRDQSEWQGRCTSITRRIHRVLIPLAAPFVLKGQVGVAGMIVVLSISATVVDSTPFSTVGASTLATAPEEERSKLFRAMLKWGFLMAVPAPAVTCLLFLVFAAQV